MSRRDVAKSRQLLQPSEEEATIKDWPAHESGAACPVHPRDLFTQAKEISGNLPDSPVMTSGSSLVTRSISTGLQFEFGSASIPAVLSYDEVMNSGREDLWKNIQFLYSRNKTLFEMHLMQSAQLAAVEDHCTLKKRQKSKKLDARFFTYPELKAASEAEIIERIEKEKVDAEKAAQKIAENDVRIEEDIETKVFDGSLSSYKHKDDLIPIAGALLLPRDGTMTARIKEHLAENPDCASQPRFAGLLGGERTSAATTSAASASSQPQNLPLELPATSSSS